MSGNEIVIIDSDEEVIPICQPRGLEDVVTLSDSDSDGILFEEEVIKSDIQYVCRAKRSLFRRQRRNRQRRSNNISKDTTQHSIPSESDQSRCQSECDVTTNSLKNELITPTKNNPLSNKFKSSPHFESSNQCSAESSSQPLPQISDNNGSESSSQQSSQMEANSSVISPSVVSPDCPPAIPADLTPNASPIPESIDAIDEELKDIGVEDKENSAMDCDMSTAESELLRSPVLSERSSTPDFNSNIMELEVQHTNSDTSAQTSPLKSVYDINERATDTMNTLNGTVPLNSIEMTAKTLNQSFFALNESQNSDKSKKDIGIGTENLIQRLSFDEIAVNESGPVDEYYVCSHGCGQEFNNALLHYKHEKRHTNELIKRRINTFKCQSYGCTYKGLTQIELMYHNSEHIGIFMCHQSDCLFRAQTPDHIIEHMKAHRLARKRFKGKGIYCECGEKCCQNTFDS